MKIAICDDDLNFTETVKEHLLFYSGEHNTDFEIHTFTNGKDLINSEIKFNIAILDVEMPGCDGIELGKILREKNRHIVLMYITSHKKYLDDALNLNAVRFFEKPLDLQRFYRGLGDAVKRIDNTSINFYLKDQKITERISAQDIVFVEIEKRKTKVVTHDKEYHSDNHISFWKDNLTSTIFISPHKSYIINFNYVTSYERNRIILDDKYTVNIARNRQTEFHQKFMRFMEGK